MYPGKEYHTNFEHRNTYRKDDLCEGPLQLPIPAYCCKCSVLKE